MPRIGLSFAEVAAAFEKILTAGEQPTAEKVHELLGKGSIPSIQKFLNQIFEQSRLDLISSETPEPSQPAIENRNELPHDLLTSTETPVQVEEIAPLHISSEELSRETASLEPRAETSASSETSTDNEGAHTGHNKKFKRERFNRHSNNQGSHNQHASQNRQVEFEEAVETPLEQLPEQTLIIKIRRLESILLKEQMRREVAERIMDETKEYADSIKEQVAQRINDLRQNMDIVIEQLKAQLREQKQNFDQDLKFYQEELSKANEKIASMMK